MKDITSYGENINAQSVSWHEGSNIADPHILRKLNRLYSLDDSLWPKKGLELEPSSSKKRSKFDQLHDSNNSIKGF